MPTQDKQSQIARKVNFAIQLLREATELMDASQKTTPARLRYARRAFERHEYRLCVPAAFGLPAFALGFSAVNGCTTRACEVAVAAPLLLCSPCSSFAG